MMFICFSVHHNTTDRTVLGNMFGYGCASLQSRFPVSPELEPLNLLHDFTVQSYSISSALSNGNFSKLLCCKGLVNTALNSSTST